MIPTDTAVRAKAPRGRLGMIVLLAAGAAVVWPSPASATFPGLDGRILVEGPFSAPTLPAWTILPDGRAARRVGGLPGPAAWSPDGRRLIFSHPCPPRSGCGGNDGTPGPNELDTVDPRGAHLHRIKFRSPRGITLPGAAGPELVSGGPYEASWSPDGKRLLFIRVVPEEGGDNAIFTSRVDGRGQKLVLDGYRFTAGFGPYLGSPAFSPDGSEIAFALRGFAPTTSGAFVMARDGTGMRPLLACYFSGPAPACEVDSLDWSPNGRRLALGVMYAPFVTEQVVVVNADGSGATVIRAGSKPFWSPDGRKLGSILPAPMTAPSGSGSLQISNADGSGLRTVRRHVSFAAWQPLPRRRRSA